MIEPNCFLPWEIYLDFLADQGYDQLREIPVYSLITGTPTDSYHYTEIHILNNQPPYQHSETFFIGCTEQWKWGGFGGFNEDFFDQIKFCEGSPEELNSNYDTRPINEKYGCGG